MVTMADVAKKAGVSIMTVSRVINGVKGKVSEETRKKVLEIVKELNYYPNSVGRALHGSKLKTIGVVSPLITAGIVLENPFYYELMMGIEDVCTEKGYDVMISTRKRLKHSDYLKNYYERKVDGLIIIAPDINTIDFESIERDNIPVILVGERTTHNINYVDADNENGGFLAVEYLYNKGHRKIAILTGNQTMRNSVDRLNGFLKGIKHYDLELREEWILNGNFTYHDGIECAKTLMKLKELPTAVFCSNDLSALGFLNEIKKYDIKVPDDISVIGFDNIYASQYSTPPLTTIKQPIIEMGKAAAELLLTKIHNKDIISQGRIFPVGIIERDSVKKI
ncbi:MAG: LacI family transcriptional regulator [Brevinematales bacterium]|nr:LacI family transcriptional regulator [Brevinematales bacterium]